ncbi:hypothetical protein QBC47DRAFT_127690 [Echria macrotheca]|uniref:Uncharacterized protein n=1 Tax=Echria macrotheca TaxID=438768 RepID=A0AAJ0B5Z3_9PEZI|nr:hypothetical protein QBC47DRAFT_127690 [Echria macrotheca]
MSYDGSDDQDSDFHQRSPSQHHHHTSAGHHHAGRDLSPDYHYAGGSPPPRASGAMPIPSPSLFEPNGVPLYAPVPPVYPYYPFRDGGVRERSRDRERDRERDRDFHPRSRSSNGGGGARDRQLAPPSRARPRNPRSYSGDYSEGDYYSGSEGERLKREKRRRERRRSSNGALVEKAKHALRDTFSNSTSGLGVGVLGAIVGGLAAREVSERHSSGGGSGSGHGHGHGHHGSGSSVLGGEDKNALISTIVGAAVGGLGANAIEKRFERSRKGESREKGGRKEDGVVREMRVVEEGRAGGQVRRDGNGGNGGRGPVRTGGAADEYYFPAGR